MLLVLNEICRTGCGPLAYLKWLPERTVGSFLFQIYLKPVLAHNECVEEAHNAFYTFFTKKIDRTHRGSTKMPRTRSGWKNNARTHLWYFWRPVTRSGNFLHEKCTENRLWPFRHIRCLAERVVGNLKQKKTHNAFWQPF